MSMSWWTDLKEHSREIARDLDTIADRVGAKIERRVAPVIHKAAASLERALAPGEATLERRVAPVIHKAAASLERALAPGEATLSERVRTSALAIDRRYQEFMVNRVDPLFGQARNQHLKQIGNLEISGREVMLNRQIAMAGTALIVITLSRAFAPALLAIAVPASFVIALPVYKMAVSSVKTQRRVTYHVVSAISTTAIWLRGYYTPALFATMAFYMGEKLLMVTEDRSHKGLISVFAQQPRTVTVVVDGDESERPLEELSAGDVVVVHAGGFMPVDGVVLAGDATIDQHMLTGEAQPAEKSPGDQVYASTVVLAGKLHVRVDCAGADTVAAKIGDVLNRTASYQLALQSKGSKIAHDSALPLLLVSGLALGTLGPEAGLAALNSSMGVSLRMSGPVTMLNLLNIASHNGILLKDGRSLDLLSEVDTVVFDKTGTLTLTQPNVGRIIALDGFSEEELLTLAAGAERQQSHPIALAIIAEADARGVEIPTIDHASYEVGYGITVTLNDLRIKIGSDRFMALEGVIVPPDVVEEERRSHELGHSLIMIAVDDRLAGAIELQPTIRPEAGEVIARLRERGLEMVIISGDHEEPTRRLAERVGMDRHFANVLPEGKASLVEQLQAEGHVVCFVGDGINDSIALKKANVSVSLRGATTVATDSAQIVLMQESLEQLPFLFELGDDMAWSMRWGYAAGMVPGVITLGGVFFLGWGFVQAISLSVLGLATGLGIAMYPLRKHGDPRAPTLDETSAPPPEIEVYAS